LKADYADEFDSRITGAMTQFRFQLCRQFRWGGVQSPGLGALIGQVATDSSAKPPELENTSFLCINPLVCKKEWNLCTNFTSPPPISEKRTSECAFS